MTPPQAEHFRIIDASKKAVLEHARGSAIPLVHIDHVATFEQWDRGIEVWCFFETDQQSQEAENNGTTVELERIYRNC